MTFYLIKLFFCNWRKTSQAGMQILSAEAKPNGGQGRAMSPQFCYHCVFGVFQVNNIAVNYCDSQNAQEIFSHVDVRKKCADAAEAGTLFATVSIL